MPTDIPAAIAVLRTELKAAARSAFVPTQAIAAMTQACSLIELLAGELASMQNLLDRHLEAHLAMGH